VGFAAKHKERDSKLPLGRQNLLNKIEEDLTQDGDVLGVFIGGSLAVGNEDLYSDIDLRVIVKPETFSTFVKNKRLRPHHWGRVLFFEEVSPKNNYTIAHFDCFIKVDSFYYQPKDVQPSVWLKSVKAIYDPKGIIKSARDQSKQLAYEPTIEEFEVWRGKVFAYIHEVYRRVMRNEFYYALTMMNGLRWTITAGWYMEKGLVPNSPGDWSKIEGKRSPLDDRQQSLLESWDCKRDPRSIMNVLSRMVPEIKAVHKSLCEKHGIPENPEQVDEIIKLVL
jgi:predicted nucleotidyltransferase